MKKSRGLLFVFMTFFGVLLMCAITMNFYVNPFGYYGDKSIGENGLTNARKIKLDHIRSLGEKPEIIVLGSSNSMRMLPSSIESYCGVKAFNCGVYQATVEDYYCLSKAMFEQNICSPKLIILCVDDWNFKEYETKSGLIDGASARLSFKPELARYLDGYSDLKLAGNRFLKALEWDQLRFSIKELSAFNFDRKQTPLDKAFFNDGVRKFYFARNEEDVSELAETGQYDVTEAIIQNQFLLEKFSNADKILAQEGFENFSEKRFEILSDLFDLLESNNCFVIVNIMPMQPYFQKIVEAKTNYLERMEYLKEALAKEKEKHDNVLLIKDNSRIQNFGGSVNHFFDNMHPTSVNSDKMLQSIIQNFPCSAI